MSEDAHTAEHDSECPLCHELIWGGDDMVAWLAPSSAWAHVECIERLERSYA